MSLPDDHPVEFRPEFVDDVVSFFDNRFGTLQPKERAHAIGVVANTLAALAVNQSNSVDVGGIAATLDTLNTDTNESIKVLVNDESVSYLFPQSARICDVVRAVISERRN